MATTGNKVFSPTRLRVARLFRGLNQTELGELIGVSHQFVAYLETGQRHPTPLATEAIADCLGFKPSFFFGGAIEEFRDEECFFRKQSTPVSVKSRVLAHGSLFGALVDYFDAVLRLPAPNAPTIRVHTNEEIERASERCRMSWGLGVDLPIANLVRAVERAGVVVTRFQGHASTIDAFSRIHARCIIVLNTDKGSGTRSNYDLAHEVGHLVMHNGEHPGSSEMESQADRFASALLLPRAGFVREFPRPRREHWPKAYWDSLFRMKTEWRASVPAIIRRAFDLGMINAAAYHRAYKYMSAQGWLKGGEPVPIKADEPELVGTCFRRLEERLSIRPAGVADALGWRYDTLAEITGLPLPEVLDQQGDPPRPAGKVVALRRPNKPAQVDLPLAMSAANDSENG